MRKTQLTIYSALCNNCEQYDLDCPNCNELTFLCYYFGWLDYNLSRENGEILSDATGLRWCWINDEQMADDLPQLFHPFSEHARLMQRKRVSEKLSSKGWLHISKMRGPGGKYFALSKSAEQLIIEREDLARLAKKLSLKRTHGSVKTHGSVSYKLTDPLICNTPTPYRSSRTLKKELSTLRERENSEEIKLSVQDDEVNGDASRASKSNGAGGMSKRVEAKKSSNWDGTLKSLQAAVAEEIANFAERGGRDRQEAEQMAQEHQRIFAEGILEYLQQHPEHAEKPASDLASWGVSRDHRLNVLKKWSPPRQQQTISTRENMRRFYNKPTKNENDEQ